MNEEYTVGECAKCGKGGGLKNGLCPDCQGIDTNKFPDIFKDIFGGFTREQPNGEKK